MIPPRKFSNGLFALPCFLLFLACLSTAQALYTPPASNPFITDPSETVTTLNISSGSISDAQTQLNNARSANASAVIVLNLTGTYTVTNQALTLPSKTCLVLQSHAVIQASPSITASALIQTTSQSLVSIAGGTLNGNGTNVVGILVTTCDRVEIDDVSIQDCGQDGIRLTGHGNTNWDNEMTVTRCTVFGCGANGINASNSTQFVAVDNNCYDNTAAGLLIGGAHSSVAKNTSTANGTGISVTGTPNNAITDNEIDDNGTGIALGSGSASNWCTSNNFASNTVVGIAAAGTGDIIFDNTFSGNASNLSATGTNNHIVARKGALSASGQDYFYPPLIDDQHGNTTIVNGLGRTDVTIGATTMSSVQSQYNSARTAHPGNVIVLHLTGANYTGDATLNLSSNTCVLLSGTITLNSGVTGFVTTGSGANHISVSGGTVDGQNTTGRNALSFSDCHMVQIDGMTLNNFGSDVSAISGSDIIHFTGGTNSAAPYLVSRCTMNGSAGRAIWSQMKNQAVYTNNNNANTRAGIDLDSATHNALVKFNTFTGSRYGLFIEQSDQYNQGIGNNCVNNTGRGINLLNNTEDVAMQYNSVVCNISNGNSTGLRSGSTGNTSSGTPTLALHNFLFGNQCFNNAGDGIESDPTGSQNLYSQTNLGGNGTPIVTSGSEVFFNPVPPPVIAPTFTIVANAGANGSISPAGTVVVDQGTNKTFTITPNSGYSVSSVTVDGTSVGAVTSYTFTDVQTNHVISATFAANGVNFTITASAGSGGTISPAGGVTVNQGASQTFTIAANSGFAIASVAVDGSNVGAVASYTFSNVQANHTISATFSAVTSTEINDTDAGIAYTGSWSYSANRTHGEYQADVHVTTTNGASVSYTFNGTGVSYITETYTDEGNVSFYIDGVFQQTVSCVSSTRIAQVAVFTASGLSSGTHTLKAVKVDGTYMLLDALIVTNVVTPTYTITASAGSGGTVSPAGGVTVNQGASQTFTVAANSGYTISSVLVDGSDVGAVASYTFTNVQANHTISATFSATTPTEINDTDAGIVYTGSWSYSANRTHGEYQADVHVTTTNGASVSYTFNGTGVSYITETYTDEGNVSFYIDGVFQQTVSCVSSTRIAQVAVFTASGLSSGTHTLKAVKVDGTYMLLDALIITSGGSSPVVAPTFSPGGGTYTSAQSVTISTTTAGASIRYTTDGSAPSETIGTLYSGPVSISASTTLKAIAYKSGMTDSTVSSAAYSFSVTVTASTGFYNQTLPAAETGTFTATFDATVSLAPSNAIIGLSQGAAAAYTDIAAAVRFNPSGDIDARNGGAFAAASTIPFTAGTSYHFRMVINVPAHTYSIYVTPAGGSELTVGTNYAFRTEQVGVTQLDNWNADVNTTPGGSVTVSNFLVQ